MRRVDRREDMSPDGFLSIVEINDGDMLLTIAEGKLNGGIGKIVSAQFCTFVGGGQSPRTLVALKQLAEALSLDNETCPARAGHRPQFTKWEATP
jgi:hypothetical protein